MHAKTIAAGPAYEAEIRGRALALAAGVEDDAAGGQRIAGRDVCILIIVGAIGRVSHRAGEIVGATGRTLKQLVTAHGGEDLHIAAAADGEFLRETHRVHGIVEEAARGEYIAAAEASERRDAEDSEQNDHRDQLDQRKSGIVTTIYYNHVNWVKNSFSKSTNFTNYYR